MSVVTSQPALVASDAPTPSAMRHRLLRTPGSAWGVSSRNPNHDPSLDFHMMNSAPLLKYTEPLKEMLLLCLWYPLTQSPSAREIS